jgi:hypothetical protein
MAKPSPQRATTHRCLSVLHTVSGEWIARERGAVERSFSSQKAAHFALFELGAGAPAPLLTPRSESVAGDEP